MIQAGLQGGDNYMLPSASPLVGFPNHLSFQSPHALWFQRPLVTPTFTVRTLKQSMDGQNGKLHGMIPIDDLSVRSLYSSIGYLTMSTHSTEDYSLPIPSPRTFQNE